MASEKILKPGFLELSDLPLVRGRYTPQARLADQTWFRVGGATDVLFRPADGDDLSSFLSQISSEIPITILGAGSNVLVRDGGISGVVIRLGRGFSTISVEDKEAEIYVGAGCLDRTVALHCQEIGLGGLEFLVGIPGTIGGAVKMNAGAYGTEIKDVLIWADVLDPQGIKHRLSASDLGFSYRHSELPENWIVVGAALEGNHDDPQVISEKLHHILAEREATQPTRGRTGGSTFKNPLPEKAWELIDKAGCRGLKVGDAQVSEKHCNFLLNLDQATAQDLETLGEEVRSRVLQKTGHQLEWEIIRLGV